MIVTNAEAVDRLLSRARTLGAGAADASVSEGLSMSAEVRMGAFEGVERSEGRSAALRAFFGHRQAAASTSDVSPTGLDALAERVVAMARAAPEDPWCGLADPALQGRAEGDLDPYDPTELSAEQLEEIARTCEDAARSVTGVSNSAGASAYWGRSTLAFGDSNGFRGDFRSSSFGHGVAVVAERDGARERDYAGRGMRHFADLPDPAQIGREAGERTVRRIGARRIETTRAAVLFEPRVARGLIGSMLGAITGPAIARGVSFLKDRLGSRVFAEGIEIVDDPLRRRGAGSHLFDGEGVVARRHLLVEDGVLTTWLLNSASARQLGLTTTGHATLPHGGPPGVSASNVWLQPGPRTPQDLLAGAGGGLMVTETFSPSLNPNTGDWSVGVAGFWQTPDGDGFPVSEITVAGNMLDIYARLVPASDLEFRGSLDTPSILVDALTVAGA